LLRGGQALARALHLLLMIRAACIAWLVLQTSLAAASDNDDVIVVHLVPHSHIDAGWLVNFDEYQASSVDVILDNVLVQLEQNSTRTFALGEMAFFASWYARQPLGVRARFRKLVASGQVEFVNGGWVQHDEACALYGDMLDQTTRGHQFLLSEFNVRPATTWQLDPFGHSATSSLFLRAGELPRAPGSLGHAVARIHVARCARPRRHSGEHAVRHGRRVGLLLPLLLQL